ncbi:MAG: hypothetical protein OXJ37_18790 [Bryobacterales bacterium]|nr:hypothetical protein [Bryobacterales bacterium]MDE0264458.1 hypothetical protein [Bryobacterales bacterium]MDE0622150.1 hypothetical protein [Bryobacterales bacterium]
MEINEILNELKTELDQNSTAIAALSGLPTSRETKKVLDYLQSNRALVEDAVVALANLERSRGKRRGRRPAWIEEVMGSRGAS